MTSLEHAPVFGICGGSGAGKTTLIVDLVHHLRSRGLAVVVIKHDAHGLTIDRPGTDSARFFVAGADVVARDPVQSFVRLHAGDQGSLDALVAGLSRDHDVILVEGHKSAPLPHKLWLRRHGRDRPPRACEPIALDLRRNQDRLAAASAYIEQVLAELHLRAPTLAGILIGGQSRRMGRPKHLLGSRGRTWLSRIVAAVEPLVDDVVLLGAGHVPRSCARLARLPDVPGQDGPLAGICAALRFRPDARWLFLSCDSPRVTRDALRWLKAQARPGTWAVQPRLRPDLVPQPFPGWYDFRAAAALQSARGPIALAQHPRTALPEVPSRLEPAWLDCNTPADRRRFDLPSPSARGRSPRPQR